MKKTGHTRIDDLNAFGHELAEEHLALVSGGSRPRTKDQTDVKPGGDVQYDYYA
jgi:hypothetical protein